LSTGFKYQPQISIPRARKFGHDDLVQVLKRVPNLKKLDGMVVDPEERDAAIAAVAAAAPA
jgi:hypothetical protein